MCIFFYFQNYTYTQLLTKSKRESPNPLGLGVCQRVLFKVMPILRLSGLDKIIETLRPVENITSTYTMPILFGQGGDIDD